MSGSKSKTRSKPVNSMNSRTVAALSRLLNAVQQMAASTPRPMLAIPVALELGQAMIAADAVLKQAGAKVPLSGWLSDSPAWSQIEQPTVPVSVEIRSLEREAKALDLDSRWSEADRVRAKIAKLRRKARVSKMETLKVKACWVSPKNRKGGQS